MKRIHLTGVLAALLVAAAVVASSPARTAAVPAYDEHFLKAAAQGSLYEIAVGNAVLQKGSGDACTVAKMLVTDHGKSLSATRAVAKQVGVKLPTRPNPVQRALVVELARADGFRFQRMFASLGVADHRHDIAEAKEASKKAQEARVKTLARNEIPVLTQHLRAFRGLLTQTLASSGAQTGGTSTTATTTTTATTGTTTTAGSGTAVAACS